MGSEMCIRDSPHGRSDRSRQVRRRLTSRRSRGLRSNALAGEIGSVRGARSRRRNRPGNAQAKGPRKRTDAGKSPKGRQESEGAPTEQGRPLGGNGRNLSGFRTAGARRRRSYRRNPRPGGDAMSDQALKTTPLNAAHRALGARMVGFGGYDMPVQYEGVLAEHRWTCLLYTSPSPRDS